MFAPKSIRSKLLIYFLAIIILPLLTLGVLGPVMYSRTIERETTSYTYQMIRQVTRNFEFSIHDMENIISYLTQSPEIASFLESSGQAEPSPEAFAEARAVLRTYTSAHPEIAGILVVNGADQLLSNEFQRITRDPLANESWYQLAVGSPSSIQLFPRPIGRNLRNDKEDSSDDVVSVVKAVSDPASGRVKGVILIDMKLRILEDIFANTTLGASGFIFLADKSDNIVYAPVNKVVYRVRTERLSGASHSTVQRIGGSDYQLMWEESPYTRWKTVGVFSLNGVLKPVIDSRYYSIIIAVLTVVIAVVTSVFFASSIARPVIKLRHLMKQVEAGNLSPRFREKGNDEIIQLGYGFNAMVVELQKLIDQVYHEQQGKREAEVKILQQQIKPHFLYNTLDTIQWMAQEHDAQDIVELVAALTKLFRIGLSDGRELISVRDEIDHVRSYLTIQKARYEEKFDFAVSVEEAVCGHKVLKLTLQPIVENAIYHGIKERRGHGNIEIEAGRVGGNLVLRVKDDGIGMSGEQLARIRSALDQSTGGDSHNGGFALVNVNERIRLAFGSQYGLRVYSTQGSGTTVEVIHPLVEREA